MAKKLSSLDRWLIGLGFTLDEPEKVKRVPRGRKMSRVKNAPKKKPKGQTEKK
jgi:hypothetical protein